MATMPKQKPGTSEQVVCTPDNFLAAVKKRLAIVDFGWDLAATPENAVVGGGYYYTEADDALVQPWNVCQFTPHTVWNWCNPPYSRLGPWVEKAAKDSVQTQAMVAMLVPAAVGSNWWRDWVDGFAYVLFLNGRLTFKGHTSPYPKDLALLLYAPFLGGGSCVWDWRKDS